MGSTPPITMLASLSGSLALLLGLAVMLLPLLSPELSRPRDSAWGALLLLLGLTLVTGADRLSGSPMLAVLCGGLLIGRLGSEVLQLRWSQLTPEEQQRLSSGERWRSSLRELSISLADLLRRFAVVSAAVSSSLTGLSAALQRGGGRGRSGGSSKRWVRPESSSVTTAAVATTGVIATAGITPDPPAETAPAATPAADTVLVHSFAEIDALITSTAGATEPTAAPAEPAANPPQRSEAG